MREEGDEALEAAALAVATRSHDRLPRAAAGRSTPHERGPPDGRRDGDPSSCWLDVADHQRARWRQHDA